MTARGRTDDGIDNEHGRLTCTCGATFDYSGYNAPETVAWWTMHDTAEPDRSHRCSIEVLEECTCGLLDHPGGCAPEAYWIR